MDQISVFDLTNNQRKDSLDRPTDRPTDRPIRKVHCFFEQSGTFKNEFRTLGIEAYDYDILNDFGQTDYQIDLFAEIEKAYDGQNSVFDDVSTDDLIFAFFPCTRFENQIMLSFRGQAKQFKKWSIKEKMLYDMNLMDELRRNYLLVNKLFILCFDRGLRLVMENPFSEEHFLRRYWCFPPSIIDKDRRENGDYYAKPTQFWFCNFSPKRNLLMEPISYNNINSGDTIRRLNSSMYPKEWGKLSQSKARSMIHPQYANRFIRQYLIDKEV